MLIDFVFGTIRTLWSSLLTSDSLLTGDKCFGSINTNWNYIINASTSSLLILLLDSSMTVKENNYTKKPNIDFFMFLWNLVAIIICNFSSSIIPFNFIVLSSFLNEIFILIKSNRTWEYLLNQLLPKRRNTS